jgi:hypothetical protein
MNFKSRQTLLSILAGMVVGTLMTAFIRPTCWGWVLGIILACYLGKVSLPKEGAIVGYLVMIPIMMYGMYYTAVEQRALESHGALRTVIFSTIAVLLVSTLGALFGLVVGKMFQIAKSHQVIFF